MRKIITVLLMGTMLVSVATSGMAQDQTQGKNAEGNQYPFCRALQLPPPPPPDAPAAVINVSPAAATDAATMEALAAAGLDPGNPPPADLTRLLKSSADYNKIVDSLLDAQAPLTSADFDTIFHNFVYKLVSDNYLDLPALVAIKALPGQYQGKINSREALDGAIHDLVHKLGAVSIAYLSAPDKLAQDVRGSFQKMAFFGAHLSLLKDGQLEISSIVPGSTADLAGFRVGDGLVSINGKALHGLSLADAEALETKPVGNQLQVVSRQDGNLVDSPYMLQQYVPSKPAIQLLPEQIAYIKMPTEIDDQIGRQLIPSLVKMHVTTAGGLAGIVLDLRYVSQASVQNVRGLLPYLIDRQVGWHREHRQGQILVDSLELTAPLATSTETTLTADQKQLLQDLAAMPLVILINGSSTAIGAEQLALALRQGRSNTSIVGEHTKGNGAESTVVQLPNCGRLTISTSRYKTRDGVFIGDVGITPDFLTLPSRQRQDGDVQLAKAVDVVRNQSADRPFNLVLSDKVNIAELGPPPDPAKFGPPADQDLQRIAYQHKLWILQSLVGLALFICPFLYLLMSDSNSIKGWRRQQRKKGE